MHVIWDGITRKETLSAEATALRDALADAARQYRWSDVFRILADHPHWVNASRPGGPSWYAPLHQAADAGAPIEVVQRLLRVCAWRTLQNACGERPVDIAERKQRRHLLQILTPEPRHRVPPGVLRKIQDHFHDVIRGRAADLVREEALRLPELEPLLELETPATWFAVPGMYGGFSYRLDLSRPEATLVSESWCRVVGGSGQRHEITCRGSALVEEGFV